MTAIYCVFGHPVAHSLSPDIHHAFAAQSGIALRYEKREAPLDGFGQSVKEFIADGGKGANVTVPFKLEAMMLADTISERARHAGAVNTLSIDENGNIRGDNTDGAGLVNDLVRLGVSLQGARIAILGAGGAVRGVLGPLLNAHPKSVVIANRTLSRVQELMNDFNASNVLQAVEVDQLEGEFDLIINGTSASLSGDMPNIGQAHLAPTGLAYDMVYASKPTPFMQWAILQDGRAADGLGMLVEQAAESFLIWHGVRPDGAPVLAQLRARMK